MTENGGERDRVKEPIGGIQVVERHPVAITSHKGRRSIKHREISSRREADMKIRILASAVFGFSLMVSPVVSAQMMGDGMTKGGQMEMKGAGRARCR
jgi:hypothetical protein